MAGIAAAAIPIAAAFAALLVLAPGTSQAGFLYVPPAEPVVVAEDRENGGTAVNAEAADEAGGGSHGVRQTGAKGAEAAVPRRAGEEHPDRSGPAGSWRVHSGEMLRNVLSRWGGDAGIEVLFLTDRRYRLHEGRTFPGSFEDAAQALFSALSHLRRPPVGEARPDGGALVGMHRASLHRASPHRPGRAGEGR